MGHSGDDCIHVAAIALHGAQNAEQAAVADAARLQSPSQSAAAAARMVLSRGR